MLTLLLLLLLWLLSFLYLHADVWLACLFVVWATVTFCRNG